MVGRSLFETQWASFSIFNCQFSIQKEHTMTASCPECEATITLAADVVEGEIIVCPDCAAELELTSVDPAVLALAPEVGEDWGE
jgi:alpha-aminoadipate/glutamate carrier protein LysW